MSAADPTSLDRLHDVVVPPPAPWWPPAPAWYVVASVLLALLLFGAWRAASWWRRNRYRRAALAELAALARQSADRAHRSRALPDVAVLVKRTALAAFPRARVASLSGEPWLQFLDHTANMEQFTGGAGRPLAELAYDSRLALALDDAAVAGLLAAVRRWLRHHHAEAPGLPR